MLGTLLRRVGFKVKSIFEVYPRKRHESTSDPTWIKRCAKENWIAITGDKKIELNPINKQAVIDAKCKIFVLSDSNSKAEEWAAAVICGRDKIINTVRKNEGPFFANIGKQSHSHVTKPRFPEEESKKKAALLGGGTSGKQEQREASKDTDPLQGRTPSVPANPA